MKVLESADAVRNEVRRLIQRQRPREGELDLSEHEDEIEALVASVQEFLPVWTVLPSVFRVVRIDGGGTTAVFTDNLALPAAKHTLDVLVEMLNFIRKARDLQPVTMPLFLQPDDIRLALASPAPCHCDEEREVIAQERSWKRAGGSSAKRWLYVGQDVLDRDGRRCTRCGASKDLHVHAVEGGKKWTDIAGYVTLCRRCHVLDGGAPSAAATALSFHLEDGADRGIGDPLAARPRLREERPEVGRPGPGPRIRRPERLDARSGRFAGDDRRAWHPAANGFAARLPRGAARAMSVAATKNPEPGQARVGRSGCRALA